jgi:isocitrate dehydrogenase
MDIIVVRENEEDTYGAIEHQQTSEVAQCLKLVSEPGSERVIRYAFETARSLGRRKVTCLTKNNIMKMTDGLFQKVFARVSGEYSDIDAEHKLIDIGTAEIATRPEDFDVVVTLNLYGDIVSDVTALLSGSVGMAGSANIGDECAMFEAVHGSAPTIAGRGIANPSGLLHAGILMLHHIGQHAPAVRLHNAWLCTIEDGIHTVDLANERYTRTTVGTQDFAAAVAERLGREPSHLAKAVVPRPVEHPPSRQDAATADVSVSARKKALVGVDVFLDWDEGRRNPDALGEGLSAACSPEFHLTMITNRGTKVYPGGAPETLCTDHWRCRFMANAGTCGYGTVVELLSAIHAAGYDVIKTENLYTANGAASYSLGQGE